MTAAAPRYHVALGYLRAFLTALVVGHHAALAYHPFAPPARPLATPPYWWAAFPVVDGQRSMALALFVGFNDVFFMALMFLLSGLFFWPSLQRKGAGAFLRERARRLGVPFLVAAALLAPLAYFPSYVTGNGDTSLAGFARAWLALGTWPAGPAWFIWVLLAFDTAAAALTRVIGDWPAALARRLAGVLKRPAAFFGWLLLVSFAAYAPLALLVGPIHWTALGPFAFQTSRILLYAVYFAAGAAVGALGVETAFPERSGALARRWWLWTIGALVAFAATIPAAIAGAAHPTSRPVLLAGAAAFVASCAASSFAALALFLRFATRARPSLDGLRDQAYGVYLLHYPIVSWLQLGLLGLAAPGLAKFGAVWIGALALTVAVVAALRRIPAVARVV